MASTYTAAAMLDVGGGKEVNGGSNVATAKLAAERKFLGVRQCRHWARTAAPAEDRLFGAADKTTLAKGISSSVDVCGSRKQQWRIVWWLSVGFYGGCQLAQQKNEICENIWFLKFLCNPRK
jgi:hypothetical protein